MAKNWKTDDCWFNTWLEDCWVGRQAIVGLEDRRLFGTTLGWTTDGCCQADKRLGEPDRWLRSKLNLKVSGSIGI